MDNRKAVVIIADKEISLDEEDKLFGAIMDANYHPPFPINIALRLSRKSRMFFIKFIAESIRLTNNYMRNKR